MSFVFQAHLLSVRLKWLLMGLFCKFTWSQRICLHCYFRDKTDGGQVGTIVFQDATSTDLDGNPSESSSIVLSGSVQLGSITLGSDGKLKFQLLKFNHLLLLQKQLQLEQHSILQELGISKLMMEPFNWLSNSRSFWPR